MKKLAIAASCIIGVSCLVAGASYKLLPASRDVLTDSHTLFQYNIATWRVDNLLIEVGVIPGASMEGDVPVITTFRCDTYFLANPQYPQDRFVVCSTTDRMYGCIPYTYDKSIIRLGPGFPVPDESGKIFGKPYPEAIFELYEKHIDKSGEDETYFSRWPVDIIMYGKDWQTKYKDYTIFDLRAGAATQKDQVTTLNVNGGTVIRDIGNYLISKYKITHDDPRWWDADFARLWNHTYDVAIANNGDDTFSAYVRIPNKFRFVNAISKFFGLEGYQDFGIYVDCFSSRYMFYDEVKFFGELVRTAEDCAKGGDGFRYDSTYRYSNAFKYNQVKFGNTLFDDIVRWMYADPGIKGRRRCDYESRREHVYKNDDFKTDYTRKGFKYDLTIAYNTEPMSERDEQFDFSLTVKNTNTILNDTNERSICGYVFTNEFPKMTDIDGNLTPEFIKAVYLFGLDNINNPKEHVGKQGLMVHPKDQGIFTIYRPNQKEGIGEPITKRLFGRNNGNSIEHQFIMPEYDETMRYLPTHGRYYTNKFKVKQTYKCCYTEEPKGLKNLANGHHLRCYAFNDTEDHVNQFIYICKRDPIAQCNYDRILFWIKNENKHFFKPGCDVTADIDRILEISLKTRIAGEELDGFGLRYNTCGELTLDGAVTDYDGFDEILRFNFEDGTSPRLIFAK